jgi:hypothetical protein
VAFWGLSRDERWRRGYGQPCELMSQSDGVFQGLTSDSRRTHEISERHMLCLYSERISSANWKP